MAELAPQYDEVISVRMEEVGVARVTAFCPECDIQVFGSCYCTVEGDLVAHMNEFHALVGRSGHA